MSHGSTSIHARLRKQGRKVRLTSREGARFSLKNTLRKNSEPIEKVGDNEKKLIKDLFETMYHNNGIGLAAIQVGIPKRIIVLDVSQKDKKKNPLCFINPIIKNKSIEKSIYE